MTPVRKTIEDTCLARGAQAHDDRTAPAGMFALVVVRDDRRVEHAADSIEYSAVK